LSEPESTPSPSAVDSDAVRGAETLPGEALPGQPGQRRRAVLLDGLAVLALVAATAALYHQVLDLWWISDDFFNLRWANAWTPADYTFDPAVWRQLPFRMLTPLLFASYDTDLALFGPHPRGFYVHQLAGLALAAAALYLLLRCWLARRWALFGAWCFLASVPVLSLAPLVMVRHYIECVALAALATLAWVAALRAGERRRRGVVLASAAALLWLAAAAAKEIAVPLAIVLPFLPEGTARRRMQLALPLVAAALVYVGYRYWMLGAFVGGYGWVVPQEERLRQLVGLPAAIGRQVVGVDPLAGGIALAVLLAGTLLAALSSRRAAALVALGAVSALLPVLPVASEMVPRYAVAAATLLAVAAAVGLARARNMRHTVGLIGAVALLVANRQAWSDELPRRQRMSTEYRALLELPAGHVVRRPAGPPASLAEVARFGADLLGRPSRAGWFVDDFYVCRHAKDIRRLWQYDHRRRTLADRTASLPSLRRRYCGGLRNGAPLAVELERRDGVLSWSLGPYRTGTWSFVFDDGVTAHAVPRRGAFDVGPEAPGPLRVRYDSAAGWTTYSPVLAPPLANGRGLRWQRPDPRRRTPQGGQAAGAAGGQPLPPAAAPKAAAAPTAPPAQP
jgi:hypothetical protein